MFLFLKSVLTFFPPPCSVLIGNVKDIIAQATQNQDNYMRMFDNISQYMFRCTSKDKPDEHLLDFKSETSIFLAFNLDHYYFRFKELPVPLLASSGRAVAFYQVAH